VTDSQSAKIRIELARGHLVLEELEETLHCLERALENDPTVPGLDELVAELARACRAAGSPWLRAVEELRGRRHAEPAPAAPAPVVYEIPRAETPAGAHAIPLDWDSDPADPAAPIDASEAEDDPERIAHVARLESWLGRVRARYAKEGAAHVS